MKILAIGTSNNEDSINRTLALYTASLVSGADVETLHIGDYEMPIFSESREQTLGQPEAAKSFLHKIGDADALVISFAEHNGSYTAAWKNLFDWASRIERKVFQDKPAIYLSTSPGPGGAASVLEAAKGSAPFFGADLVAGISVPSFHENFDKEKGEFRNSAIDSQLSDAAESLALALASKGIVPQPILPERGEKNAGLLHL